MKKYLLAAAGVLAIALVPTQASAALVNTPVPTNTYITVGGLDWAWADPCDGAGSSCSLIDLSYQSQFGWHLPTPTEFATHPTAYAFVFPGANVPANGTDPVSQATFADGSPNAAAACATPYFNTYYRHCDWGDGTSGYWFNPASPGTYSYDTLVVRNSSLVQGVPEPATWAMMLMGFGAIGFAFRRRAGLTERSLAIG